VSFTVDEYSAAALIPINPRSRIAGPSLSETANSDDVSASMARPTAVTWRVGRLSAARPAGICASRYPSRYAESSAPATA
jgi:hypothetical protein